MMEISIRFGLIIEFFATTLLKLSDAAAYDGITTRKYRFTRKISPLNPWMKFRTFYGTRIYIYYPKDVACVTSTAVYLCVIRVRDV